MNFNGAMNAIVTRNVMRNVTVSLLLTVWGAANEHTRDGVFVNADLSDIDDIVGVPGFGSAMVGVGWAVFNAVEGSVTLLTSMNTTHVARFDAVIMLNDSNDTETR